jgi:thiamine-phosphate pyrophosphorylase
VLLTESLCGKPWRETLEAVIRGGAGCVQLREKSLEGRALLERAHAVRELTRRRGVLFAMNDRPDIARLADADIIHVGQDDLAVRDVRRIVGGAMLVGKSTHTIEQFEAALRESPDYLAVGPMFDSPTKPQPHIAGPQTLAAARAKTELPLVAIGGITAANTQQVWSAGADCVAACAAVISADDPEAAALAMTRAAGA